MSQTAALQKMQTIRSEVKTAFKEREALVDAIFVGILSRKNVFALGEPGTAKTALAMAIAKSIGGKGFYSNLSKNSTPEDLFGAADIAALKESKFRRDVEGMLPDAHLAVLDEVFKASAAVSNTMLTILNERTYKNGKELIQTPLFCAIGASNEIPDGEEQAALYDRWTIRVIVDYIANDDNMESLLKSSGVKRASFSTMTLEEVILLQEASDQMKVGDQVIKSLLELRRMMKANGYTVSDRKWVQSLDVIKAYALLQGHAEVEVEDLEFLENLLWNDPNQYKQVKRLVAKLVNPIGEQIMKITDAINSVYKELVDGKIMAADAATKIRTAKKQLEKLQASSPNPKLEQALIDVTKIASNVAKEYLGIE